MTPHGGSEKEYLYNISSREMRNLVSLFNHLTFAGYRDVRIKASYLNELLKESVYVSV